VPIRDHSLNECELIGTRTHGARGSRCTVEDDATEVASEGLVVDDIMPEVAK